MIYEAKAQFTTCDDKIGKLHFIINEAESFGDAETQASKACWGLGIEDFDIVDVKRSKVREVINRREVGVDEDVFIAEVADVRINEETNEKTEIIYKMLLFARDLDNAYERIKDYLTQGYEMIVVGIKKTRITDVVWL